MNSQKVRITLLRWRCLAQVDAGGRSAPTLLGICRWRILMDTAEYLRLMTLVMLNRNSHYALSRVKRGHVEIHSGQTDKRMVGTGYEIYCKYRSRKPRSSVYAVG